MSKAVSSGHHEGEATSREKPAAAALTFDGLLVRKRRFEGARLTTRFSTSQEITAYRMRTFDGAVLLYDSK